MAGAGARFGALRREAFTEGLAAMGALLVRIMYIMFNFTPYAAIWACRAVAGSPPPNLNELKGIL